MSAVALPALRLAYPNIPVLGVVKPGAKAACEMSVGGRIAVIATESTTRGGAYVAAIKTIRPNAQVKSMACPLFVPLVEECMFEGDIVESIIRHYLNPLFNIPDPPDTLLLGCTHYPLLSSEIGKVAGEGVTLVNPAHATAESLKFIMSDSGIENTSSNTGITKYFTTDDAHRMARVGSIFLGTPVLLSDVAEIDL